MIDFNDTKHDALLFQNGMLSDHITDAEMDFVHNLIVNPLKAQDINGAWHQYWDEQGVTGDRNFNDRAAEWLASLGHTAPDINAQWLAYWESLLPVAP